MARYYCDYCDARCSNNSSSVRTQHNNGNLHRRNVSAYYTQFIGKDVQDKIDAVVQVFEGKVARGDVIPTYATFPRPVAVSAERKESSAEEPAASAVGKSESGAVASQKRPRSEVDPNDEPEVSNQTETNPNTIDESATLQRSSGNNEDEAEAAAEAASPKRPRLAADNEAVIATSTDNPPEEAVATGIPADTGATEQPESERETRLPTLAEGVTDPMSASVINGDHEGDDGDGSDMEMDG
jgi:U1 zinc finger